MANGNKIRISSPVFGLYLFYIILIGAFEAVDCFCYVANLPQTTLASRVIVIVALVFAMWKISKCIEFSEIAISRAEFFVIIIILLIGIFKSVYPDSAYDTYNYHLVAQRRGFINYFTDHFGKGSFQVWGFRLGDRLFFLFRYILGYRMGTMLNTLVMILMYIQVYHLLKHFENRASTKKIGNDGIVSKIFRSRALWAFMIIMVQDAVLMIGTYYVDILALPLGLEVLNHLLRASEKEPDKKNIYYFALLNGIWFAFKMTNIVFVVPCIMIYIVMVRKKLSVKIVSVSGIFAALPCSVYLVYNFVSTGNPVFPYFNAIFKSEYFNSISFKDQNWGGTNLFEKVFWLIYLIFKPEYRQSEIPGKYNFVLILGFFGLLLVCVMAVIRCVKKNYHIDKIDIVVVLLLSSALLWSFSTGYGRYFLFGMMLLGILAYYLILNMAVNRIAGVISVVLTITVAEQTGMTLATFYSGQEWSWNEWTEDAFIEQYSSILGDKFFSQAENMDIDMFFLTDSYYSGYAEMLNPSVYTYNAAYTTWWLDDDSVAMEALKQHEELLDGNVYDFRKRVLTDIDEYVDNVNSYGMAIESMDIYDSDIGNCVLVKMDNSDEQENIVLFSDEEIIIEGNKALENGTLNFICGRVYEWERSPKHEIVISKIDGGDREEVFRREIDNVEIENYQVNLGKMEKDTSIHIEFYDLAGNQINKQETNKYFILNPVLTKK